MGKTHSVPDSSTLSGIEIKEVNSNRDLKEFIDFPELLYKNSPYYVPPFFFDQKDTLNPKTNPSSSFCESALYLAYKDGKPAGRIAAIVNTKANAQWSHQEVRFGWFDFIDDREVSSALMEKVYEFGKARGMDKVVGPLGFTDFDPEGMLVEGFDKESTMALIYNYPYYNEHMVAMGFEKDADWIEYRIFFPEKLPEKMERLAKVVMERSNVHIKTITRKSIRKGNYTRRIFNLINECYKDLYNYTVMPDDLADKYIGFYLSVLDLKYITIIENEKNEPVAFGITMPSLAKALKKSRGKFMPFGWIPLLKALFIKHEEGVEMLLIGVKPEYRNTGINTLLFADLFSRLGKMGLKWAETNAILEDNTRNLGQWDLFEHERAKRRRSYIKNLFQEKA